MKIIRQTIRGCTDLPYVGEHPGVFTLVMFILAGAFAGSKGGTVLSVISGAALMATFMLPIFLYGAYTGANLSDELVQKKTNSEQ